MTKSKSSTKRKAADAAEGSKSTKKNKSGKRTAVHAVLMRNGDVQDFKRAKDKEEFVEDNKEIVHETKDFATVKDFKEWKKIKESAPVSPKSVMKTDSENGLIKMSPDDAKQVKEAVHMVNDLKPADGIYVYYKTTSRSNAVGVVIRFLDKSKTMLSELGGAQNRYILTFSSRVCPQLEQTPGRSSPTFLRMR